MGDSAAGGGLPSLVAVGLAARPTAVSPTPLPLRGQSAGAASADKDKQQPRQQQRPSSYSGGSATSAGASSMWRGNLSSQTRGVLVPSASSSSVVLSGRKGGGLGLPGRGEVRPGGEGEDAAKARILMKNQSKVHALLATRDLLAPAAASTGTVAGTVVKRRPSAPSQASTHTTTAAATMAAAAATTTTTTAAAAAAAAATATANSRTGSGGRVRPSSIDNDPAKARRRAEIYAINAYLRSIELRRFQEFKDEIASKIEASEALGPDEDLSEVSWSSDLSSVMPSPTYRTPKEKAAAAAAAVAGASSTQRGAPSAPRGQAAVAGGVAKAARPAGVGGV